MPLTAVLSGLIPLFCYQQAVMAFHIQTWEGLMRNGHCLPAAGQTTRSSFNLARLKDSRSTKSIKIRTRNGNPCHCKNRTATTRVLVFSGKVPLLLGHESPLKADQALAQALQRKVILGHPLYAILKKRGWDTD